MRIRDRGGFAALCLLCGMSVGCTRNSASTPSTGSPADESADAPAARADDGTASPLEGVFRRALAWAVELPVDPMYIRDELGMKGVKHFVEYLDLLHHTARYRPETNFAVLARRHALEALEVTRGPAYHVLGQVDDRRFRQDSMSYLRACYLAERFGFETRRYREEIERVLPRIIEHLSTRGVDQRMGFALLFEQLGLPVAEPLARIFPESLIARRVPLEYYAASPDRPYDITHEIFAMTHRGARAFPFAGEQQERYTRETVRRLLGAALVGGQIDIAAELLTNLAYLGEGSTPLARRACDALVAAQNSDGSFGRYDAAAVRRLKRNPRYDVRIGGQLHTTMVVLWALVECVP